MDRHRATTSTGAVVDDPTVGQLAELVAEVDRSGRHGFLFVERRAAGLGETYLQARREHDGWVLELRDGGPARQYRAVVAEAALVYAAVASWLLHARSAWQSLTWEQVGGRAAIRGLAVAG